VVRTEDQYVFFTDGLPVVTTPVPDIAFVEEFVHFSLSAHPAPEKILFLGNGAGGAINEALKYSSVNQIDYVELDPALLRTIGRFETHSPRPNWVTRECVSTTSTAEGSFGKQAPATMSCFSAIQRRQPCKKTVSIRRSSLC